MKNTLKLSLIVLLIFFSFQFPIITTAEETTKDISLTELVIQVMPEYTTPDNWSEEGPAVLYGQHGLFVNETDEAYDGKLSVRIPLDDPTLNLALVGQVIEEGTLDVEYTINEDTQTVEWTPNEPLEPGEEYRYAVEYYFAPFGTGKSKAFTFKETIDKDVPNMSVLFFEPVEAENVKLSEEPNDVLDMYGTPVHEYNVADVKAGDTFELDISYEKDSEITTLEALEQHAPDDDIHQGLAATDDNDGAGTFISNESAIMISISIIIAGLFVYLGLRNRQKAPTKRTNTNKSQHIDKSSKSTEKEKKKLRKQLIDGQIDEGTYKKRISEIN